MIFEVLQKLVELLGAAAAVCEDLHLVGHPLGRPRLNVPQVDPPLLQEEEEKEDEEEEDDEEGMRRGEGGGETGGGGQGGGGKEG